MGIDAKSCSHACQNGAGTYIQGYAEASYRIFNGF